jgi:hypothetical protein
VSTPQLISEALGRKMLDLYEKGTVIELEEKGEKKILRYRKYYDFKHYFLNLTPNSELFGKEVFWDARDLAYCEWAEKSAKIKGKLSYEETDVIVSNPQKASKLIEILLSKEN